jgi:hypothetical protein
MLSTMIIHVFLHNLSTVVTITKKMTLALPLQMTSLFIYSSISNCPVIFIFIIFIPALIFITVSNKTLFCIN